MHTSLSAFLLYAWLYAFSVAAAPVDSCDAVNGIVLILRGPLKAVATSFCSSYLHLPYVATQTATNTVYQTNTQTSTLPNPTSTATTTTTVVNLVTSTKTSYTDNPTVTTTATFTGPTTTIYQRHRAKRGIPPQLLTHAASRISSACSCVVSPTTSTITQTASVTSTVTTQVEVGGTATVYVTQISTVQTTSEVDITTNLGPTSTVTSVVTTTVRPVLVKPKLCNAQGLPGANAFNYDANFNTNQANCLQSCKTDARCYSTGFYIVTDPTTGSQTGTCRKYDKSVTDSADLGPGYYNFNDKAC